MKCNIGRVDQIVRIILGITVILVGVIYSSWWGLLGIIFIVTGLFRFCPFYTVFGISGCNKNK